MSCRPSFQNCSRPGMDRPPAFSLRQHQPIFAWRRGGTICIPADVAHAWRSSRQARLARLLKSSGIDIAVMTLSVAQSVGLMCADANRDDVVDLHVVLCARQRRHAVVTSDLTTLLGSTRQCHEFSSGSPIAGHRPPGSSPDMNRRLTM